MTLIKPDLSHLIAQVEAGSAAIAAQQSNPYRGEHVRSSYAAWRSGALVHPLNEHAPVSLRISFVHHSFRSLVLNPQFSCVAAKSALNGGGYRFGLYDSLAGPAASAALAHDLWLFSREQPSLPGPFTTFVASFSGPVAVDETAFERQLWSQLQQLHELDHVHDRWDAAVSADPAADDFGFSFAGRAFFVVGLHPAASRWTRRFTWPTLIFNTHEQFEQLRADGKFERMQRAIRERDRALQGSINAMLSDFGERSEARQYAGRAVADDWRCPFRAQPVQSNEGER